MRVALCYSVSKFKTARLVLPCKHQVYTRVSGCPRLGSCIGRHTTRCLKPIIELCRRSIRSVLECKPRTPPEDTPTVIWLGYRDTARGASVSSGKFYHINVRTFLQ